MPATTEYSRYIQIGICNIIAPVNCNIAPISEHVLAVGACENVIFWNMRKGEKFGAICGEKLVTVLEYSVEKCHIAVGYSDGNIRVFSIAILSDEPLLIFSGHKSAISTLCFSPDSLLLASGGKDTGVIVWDIVNECGLYRLNGHKGPVTKLCFTEDGKTLVSSSKDSFVKFWDLNSQHCFYTIPDHKTEEPVEETHVDTAANPYKNFNLWLKCKRVGSLLRQCKGRVSKLLLSSDEKLFVCQGVGTTADIYRIFDEAETQKRLRKKLRKAQKRLMKEDKEEKPVPVVSMDDLSTLFVRLGEVKVESKIKSAAFSSLAGGAADNPVKYKIWFSLADNQIEEHMLSIDGKGLIINFSDSLKSQGHRSQIRALTFSSDNASLLSGSQEAIKLWNRDSLTCIRTFPCSNVLSLLFVPGNKHCVAGTKSGQLCLFDVGAGECLEVINGHQGAIWGLSIASDQKSIASCAADKKVKLWNFDLVHKANRSRLTLISTRILEVADEALCICFSPNGKFISVGLLDNTAKVYFVDSLKFFLSLYGHSLPVLCLDISFDSKLIVTGSADKNLKIWGLDFGDCHRSLFAHDDSVTCVKFIPKTHWFFSAGKDGFIKQWDADKFQKIQVLKAHTMEVWALATSERGLYLASASHDRTLRLWECSEELLVLEEEQELEREKEHERALAEQEDIIPGEVGPELSLAAKKSLETVKSAENIIEAAEICRCESSARLEDPHHKQHPLVTALGSSSLDFFIVDILRKIRSSDMERCLLSVPFCYMIDIMRALCTCVEKNYNIELACRVIYFLTRVHHNQLINSPEAVFVLDRLRSVVPKAASSATDAIGVNLAGLRFLQMAIEERDGIQMFGEYSNTKKKKRLSEAFIMSVN